MHMPESCIRIIRGPLEPALLKIVADLYGKVDRKYADPEYCNYLFNRNPSGFSFHAIAYCGDIEVGHYSLIPLKINTGDEIKLSLKAEALYVSPAYRKLKIDWDGGQLPVGLALPVILNDYAFNQGYEVIHLLVDVEIGKIHSFAGCRQITVDALEYFLMISPNVYLERESGLIRRCKIRLVSFYQSLFIKLFAGNNSGGCREDKNIPSARVSSDLAAFNQPGKGMWSLALDTDYVDWLLTSPYIELLSVKDVGYCLVKHSEYPSRPAEILFTKFKPEAGPYLTSLLKNIISSARAKQASSVIFRQFPGQKSSALFKHTLLRNGFLTKRCNLLVYVNSPQSYFLDSLNLFYNQYFYTGF